MANGDHVLHALQNFPELTAGDLRVYAAILDNPEASRDDLASAAGLHPSTVSAARRKLEMASRCGLHWPNMSPNRDIAISPPHDHEHDMRDKNNNDMDDVLTALDFVSGKNRSEIARLPHCTLEYAQDARAWFEAGNWMAANGAEVKKPAGYLVRIMKNGDPIPPVRVELPVSSYEMQEPTQKPRLTAVEMKTARHLIERQIYNSGFAVKFLRDNWAGDLENCETPEEVAEIVINEFSQPN